MGIKKFLEENNLLEDTSREFKYGFNRSMSQKALNTSRSVENKANMMYNLGSTENNVKAYIKDAPIKETISTTYDLEKYRDSKWEKHDPNSKGYETNASQVTISKQETIDLIKKYAGKGALLRNPNGTWNKQELIHSDTVVGKVLGVNNKWVETKTFKIHYSKRGVHIVPSLRDTKEK